MEENQSQETVAPLPMPVAKGGTGFTIYGNPGTIFAALALAQADFGPIERTRTVTVRSDKGDYTFAYAPLEKVLAAVVPALNKHGLALIQPPVSENGWVMRTILGHSSGSYMELSAVIRDANTWQAFGSALTYCRRYMVGALLGVAPDEDDDGTAAEDMPRETSARSRATPPPMPSTTKPAAVQPKLAAVPAMGAAKPEAKPAPARDTSNDTNAVDPARVAKAVADAKAAREAEAAKAKAQADLVAKPDPAQNDQRPPAGLEQAPADLSQATHGNALAPTEPPLADPADIISDDGVVGEVRWIEPTDKTPVTESSKKLIGSTSRALGFTRPLLDELCVRTLGIPAGLMQANGFEVEYRALQKAVEKAGKQTKEAAAAAEQRAVAS